MTDMNRILQRVLCAAMSLTILCSGIGIASYTAGAESAGVSVSSDNTAKNETKNDSKKESSDSKSLSKTETVYVIAKADGTPDKVIVSDWIQNGKGADKIKDKSSLKDIENVKGDESYTINEDNMYEWGADGNDIYYKGTGTGELPVAVKVTYMLDGKVISADELAGKSGKVTMRFDYTNRQYEEVTVNGKKEKIYVPFVMLTGMMLDNEIFRNVEVSNGKVVNDGSHTYVAGFAMPQFKENLDLDDDVDIDIPNYVEITADVKDFELTTTLTVATNEMFSDVDFSKLDEKVEELDDKLGELTDAATSLVDGSSELYKGIGTLLNKSGDLIEGVNKLYTGAQQIQSGSGELKTGAAALAEGAEKLDSGVGTLGNGVGTLDNGVQSLNLGAADLDDGVAQLQGYISSLSGGLTTISSNSNSLNAGAAQVFNTLLSTADTQIAAAGLSAKNLTISNYGEVLNGLIGSLSEENVRELAYSRALETVTATVNSQKDVIRQGVEGAVRKQVTEGVIAAAGYSMSAEAYDAAVAAGQIPDEAQVQINTAVAAQMSGMQGTIDSNTEAQIQSIIETNMSGDEVQSQITEAVAQAAAGKQSLQALKTQLDSYNTFYQGVLNYTAGVDQANTGASQILGGTYSLKDGTSTLASGATQLKNGTGELKTGAVTLKSGSASLKDGAKALSNGASQLDAGIGTLVTGLGSLKDGSSALVDGVKALNDGSMQLSEGMKKFKEEGVDKIVEAFDGDAKKLINRLKAISKVSKNYKTYSGLADGMDGKVDFIIKTDSIEKE